MRVAFPYPGIEPVDVPDSSLVAVLEPQRVGGLPADRSRVIRDALAAPAGSPALAELARRKQKVLVLVDDHTRITPLDLIVPEVISELLRGGVARENIRLLIASGTHRAMTRDEKRARLGPAILAAHEVLDHDSRDISRLARLPTTARGTEVWVNRELLESDLVVGVGHIVPHRVAGFSGGGKIVQPGACGEVTTGQTHWLSAQFSGSEIMGAIENPVRAEIEEVAAAAGLAFIVNAVLDRKGELAACFCGSSREAYRRGAGRAREIFGAPLQSTAEIVISDSWPADGNLWQASKGIYAADLALRQGGVLVLVTPCPEGVCDEHPLLSELGYRSFAEVKALLERGEIADLALAAHLVHVGRVIREKATGILVSPGIDPAAASHLGFQWAAGPREALDLALRLQGRRASVAVLHNGGEILPLVAKDTHAGQA
jgi:nickel-dependent lactate racemase